MNDSKNKKFQNLIKIFFFLSDILPEFTLQLV